MKLKLALLAAGFGMLAGVTPISAHHSFAGTYLEDAPPVTIEGELKAIPVVGQVVVVGDAMKYLVALITLDPDKVAQVATAAGSSARDCASAAKDEAFKKALQKQIDEVNAKLAQVQTIKRWVIIPGEFSIEGGELTPTMKIKRKVVREKYAAEIAALYS